MEFLSLLYALFIGPLELFFEVLYAIAYRFVGNPGITIVFLSLAMNFLVLPLYARADAMQEAERQRAIKMKPWTDHIKKTFKGDERFMMMQTYNRQCGYKPTDALSGSVSLLLEIPFFIAAYHYLSNLKLLNGVPFGPIADLGAPDALWQFGDVTINALPIIMTAINVVSAAIYMKGFPLKSKVQMYGIAAIFLVLLYASPAGLVFYWTLNNLFSLIKNIFYKLKHPGFVLACLASVVGLALIVYVLVNPMSSTLRQGFVIVAGLALQVPIAVHFLRKRGPKAPKRECPEPDSKAFLFGCVFLAVLTGLLVPASVVGASPLEFVDTTAYVSPLWDLATSLALALGTFVVWFGVFYWLATDNGKRVFEVIVLVACVAAVVGYMFFGVDYGNLSAQLQYDIEPTVGLRSAAFNLAVLAAIAVALFLLWRFRPAIVRPALACMCVAATVMSGVTVYGIVRDLAPVEEAVQKALEDPPEEPSVHLSRNGQNVVVIMMDRAVSYYLPYLMNEDPALAKMFDGFTYYPNSISFGAYTNIGSPALYGGYDYIPEQMNARDEEPLVDKHNEALKVMPTIFSDAGFDVTVFDPTYAGYTWIPDLSIYDDIPGVRTFYTMDGSFKPRELADVYATVDSNNHRPRTFFCFSLFRVAPLALQPVLYHNGDYNSTAMLMLEDAPDASELITSQVADGPSKSVGINPAFARSYGALQALPSITVVSDDDADNFLMMSNDTMHEPLILEEPAYVPALTVDNTEYDAEHPSRFDAAGNELVFHHDDVEEGYRLIHYQVDMAALRQLGYWFDYMREMGVYDNTRIVIASDHGCRMRLVDDLMFDEGEGEASVLDVQGFNCLLMVKDFGSEGFRTDGTLMTTADVPSLALQDVVDDAVNPFTGNPVAGDNPKSAPLHVFYSTDWDTAVNNGNTFLPGYWFSVHDDIYNRDSWEYLGQY